MYTPLSLRIWSAFGVVGGQELLLRDHLGVRELLDVAALVEQEGVQLVRIDAAIGADRAVHRVDGEQLRALVVQDPCRPRADVAEALEREREASEVHVEVLDDLLEDVDHAAPGRSFAPV